ncbi:MAG: EAL domain-containing protein [Rhodospirillaceae bacterium]|nr:EAL domain-containing protein [Rhodospirillaceae bacterium]
MASRIPFEQLISSMMAVFDHLSEGIIITDTESVIQYVNQAYCEITGYSSEELIGQTPRIVRSDHHSPEFYQAMLETLRTEQGWEGQIWNRRKNGEAFLQNLKIAARRDEAGEVVQYIGIYQLPGAMDKELEPGESAPAFDYDPLTGLPVRTVFMDRLFQVLVNAFSANTRVAILYIDLDRFNHINENLGYMVGDAILKQVADMFSKRVGKRDIISRFSGDEFVVSLSQIDGPAQADAFAKELLALLEEPLVEEEQYIHLGASIGISIFPDDGDNAEELVRNAQTAMRRVKDTDGVQSLMFNADMNRNLSDMLTLENDIRWAIRQEEFEPFFQPKVDPFSRPITGMESLVRWNHPEEGMVPPGRFIGMTEENGLIVPIGYQVLRASCRHNKEWLDKGYDLAMAVNIAAAQFAQEDLVERIADILDETGLPARNLELEITEGAMIGDTAMAVERLNGLKELGIQIALDDFGTGYSSLSYLKKFPIDKLKIDQSFIRNMHEDEADSSLVYAIIMMGRTLGLKSVAEGVELKEQLDIVMKYGCREIQGFYFAKPMPAEEFEAFLEKGVPEADAEGTSA